MLKLRPETLVLKRIALLLLTVGLSALKTVGQSAPGDIVGQVTVGYQGWFSAGEPNPPDNLPWEHWSNNNQPLSPTSGNLSIAGWPDTRPYQTLYGDDPMQYPTGYGKLGNGLPATLFTSYNRDVTDIQMKWLGQNSIHTVAIGRFNPTGAASETISAGNVLATAPKYGLKFYVSYDLTGWQNYATELPADWTNTIEGQLKMTSSPNYAKQNGKPVVEIWVANAVPYTTPTQIAGLIEWLQNQGLYVIVGTSRGWRTDDANWLSVYTMANMIQPWMIGYVGGDGDSDNWMPVWKADIAYTNAHGMDFQADILPGDDTAATPQRRHGDLMWHEFANAVSSGVKSVFITMYDEFNEGNQIMPSAEDASMVPAGVSPKVATLDKDGVHCSSDYYLRLTADGGKMLQGLIPLTYMRPTQPVIPVTHLVPGTVVTFQALANGLNVTAENAGGSALIANRTAVGPWEAFQVVDAGNGYIALKSMSNNLYVTAEAQGTQPLIANRTAVGPWEMFKEVMVADGNTALQAFINGQYVTADSAGASPLIANGASAGPAQTFIATSH